MRHIRTVGTLLTAILCLAMITSNSVAPISPNTESMQAPPAQPKEDDPYEPYERFIKIFYDDSKAEVIVTSDGEIHIYFTDTSGVRYALPYTNPWDKFNSYEDIGLVKDTYPEASYIAFCANYVAGSEGLAAREFPHATIFKLDDDGRYEYDEEMTTKMSENHLCTIADIETYISIGEISCTYYYERVNCIDDFFELEGAKVTLATTLEMALYEATMADAWEKEMLNCFDLLKHQTIPDTRPYQELEAELGAYREYVVATVEAELYSNYSDAYSGGDGSTIGSFSKIERMYRRGQHYKQKTLELFDRLYRIGVEPSFIFDSQEYSESLKNSLSVNN